MNGSPELRANILHFLGLILALPAIAWGAAADYAVAFPGPSGEWSSLPLLAGYAVNIPTGIIALALALPRGGNPKLRSACLAAGIVTVLLPVAGSMILWIKSSHL